MVLPQVTRGIRKADFCSPFSWTFPVSVRLLRGRIRRWSYESIKPLSY